MSITLCELDDLKGWLGLEDDNTEDDVLNRLIESTSADFLREIRRPDFAPTAEFTDRIPGSGSSELFLRHYPIQEISSVFVNGTEIEESFDGITAPGYFFDDQATPEDRQKIILVGSVWARTCYGIPNVVVEYDAGYPADEIPPDVTQAVIEWIGWKRGYSQLQQQNQADVTWQQLGEYQSAFSAGKATLQASAFSTPQSVGDVLAKYMKAREF